MNEKKLSADDLRKTAATGGRPIDYAIEVLNRIQQNCCISSRDLLAEMRAVLTDVAAQISTLERSLATFVAPQTNKKPQTLRQQVTEFHETFGLPTCRRPEVPSDDRVRFRLRLIAEEFFELLAASGIASMPPEAELGVLIDRLPVVVNLPEFTDALADLDFVIEGTRLEFGIHGAPIAAEVHRANMAKAADQHGGKPNKPPGWLPPDIEGELQRQGWKGPTMRERIARAPKSDKPVDPSVQQILDANAKERADRATIAVNLTAALSKKRHTVERVDPRETESDKPVDPYLESLKQRIGESATLIAAHRLLKTIEQDLGLSPPSQRRMAELRSQIYQIEYIHKCLHKRIAEMADTISLREKLVDELAALAAEWQEKGSAQEKRIAELEKQLAEKKTESKPEAETPTSFDAAYAAATEKPTPAVKRTYQCSACGKRVNSEYEVAGKPHQECGIGAGLRVARGRWVLVTDEIVATYECDKCGADMRVSPPMPIAYDSLRGRLHEQCENGGRWMRILAV